MPVWVEWIIGITSIIANVVVIVGIFSYLLNRPRKKQFPLADIQLGNIEDYPGCEDYKKQHIKLCFYNKTNSQFYINRVNIHDIGVMRKANRFNIEELVKVEENYSSIHFKENGRYNPILDLCVQPNAPCVIDGYLILDYDRLLPKEITLLVITTTNKIFKYDINTDVPVLLSSSRIKKNRKYKKR